MVDGRGQRVGVWLLELDGDLRVVSRSPKGIMVYLGEIGGKRVGDSSKMCV